jgi:DHA3 family macrolide efflux protein-like MFS transporter
MTVPPDATPTHWKQRFFSIWTGQAFSLFGSRIVQFALVWWLTSTTGSATVLATSTMVALIPEIILMPIAGVYIDRWNRRLVMIFADGGIAIASLMLAYLFWSGEVQIWHIYVVMVIRAIGGAFHWPAMQASTSLMVPDNQLTRVAGMNQTLFGFLGIFGPPLGALGMEAIKLHHIMLIDVGTALLAILPLLVVQVPQPKRLDLVEGLDHPSLLEDLRFGLNYIVNWRGLVILIGMVMLFKIATTPAFTLFALLVKDHFQGGAIQFSMVETFLGVGMLVGGLLLSIWGGFSGGKDNHGRILTALTALIISGTIFIVIGFTPRDAFWLLLACVFIMGFVLPFADGNFMAFLQSSIAPEVQGRVFTLVMSLLSLSSPIGLAMAGPVSDNLGLQTWYIAGGVLTVLSAVAMMFMPAVLNIEEIRPEIMP